jgi:hypothetical protein
VSELKFVENIYLDVCAICRPYDDQSFLRIRLETDAYYLILSYIRNSNYSMIVSPAHFVEISEIDNEQEKINAIMMLKKYGILPEFNLKKVQKRSEQLVESGFGVGDAVHVAFAEFAEVKYFISCDDKLLKRLVKTDFLFKAMNPVQFCLLKDLK